MKKCWYFVIFLLIYFTANKTCNSEVITTINGDIFAVENLNFDGKNFSWNTATGTVVVPKDYIRNISFARQVRNVDELATVSADVLTFFPKALAIKERYPDSSSIVLLDQGEFYYKTDGTNIHRYRGVVYLIKEESLAAAEISLSYDPNRSKVKVLHARTVFPDGKCSSLDPTQIKITKESSGGEFFNQNETVSFTIPDARIGCIIDYAYEIEEFNPFDKNLFQGYFIFQGTDPWAESTLKVVMPKDKELVYHAINCPPEKRQPIITQANEETIYKWEFFDMPPIIPEPNMPPIREIAPGVAFCLQKDWKYMFERLRPMYEKRFQLTEAVRKKVDELTASAKTVEEKIAKLYTFCQKEIRYISIKGNLASNQVGHPAEETLKNRYGDCTDKSMLFATMLKHIGVEAYPVGILTNPNGRAIREIPIFDSDHCITEIFLDGKRFYLDPTATDFRYPYFRADGHDTMAENAMTGQHNPVPLPPPEDNAMKIERVLSLDKNGTMTVKFFSTSTGPAEASLRMQARYLKPEEYEKIIRSTISGLSANYDLKLATHSDPLDLNSPFTSAAEYTLYEYASISGKYMLVEIPLFKLSYPEVSLQKRKYDLVYPTSSLREDNIIIKLPTGFKIKYLPEKIDKKTPYIEVFGEYSNNGDTITLKRKIAFYQRRIPVKDYQQHKETLEAISKFSEKRIILEETNTKENKP